jgi:hypothetical protein
MAIDIHAFIEFDNYEAHDPFSDYQTIRTTTEGELFIWRSPEIFHALGLIFERAKLPRPPFKLRGFPGVLSYTVLETDGVIVYPGAKDVAKKRSRCNVIGPRDGIRGVPRLEFQAWLRDETAFVYELINPGNLLEDLREGERLVMNPGCLCPSWLKCSEIEHAIEVCGLSGKSENVQYFFSIVSWMKSLAKLYGDDRVRLVYWFDTVDPGRVKKYSAKPTYPRPLPKGKKGRTRAPRG